MKNAKSKSTVAVTAQADIKADIRAVTLLKGWAILGVIGLHYLAGLPGSIYTTSANKAWFIGIDQFWRFCVPLFIALSGFALAQKYAGQKINLGEFYLRRVWKLLPLYFLWSLLFFFLLRNVTTWYDPNWPITWWGATFLGHADYHLYFVPMIFQFYVLFPLLVALVRRQPNLTLVTSLGIQLGVVSIYNLIRTGEIVAPYFVTDQAQYSLFVSWIFYFVLGLWLSHQIPSLRTKSWWRISVVTVSVLGVITGLYWMVNQALAAQLAGQDPIIFLKFTRLPVLVYATGLTSGLIILRRWWLKLPTVLVGALVWLGQESYLIYLAHTLPLRIYFSWQKGVVPLTTLVVATGLLMIWIGLSKIIEKKL